MSVTFDFDEIARRVTAAGAALGLDAGDLVQHLGEVTDRALRDVVVWADGAVATLGVECSIDPNEQWLARRMTVLGAGISGSLALARTALAREGTLRIERAIGPDGPTAAVAVVGPGTLDEAIEDLAAIGAASQALAEIREQLAAFAGDHSMTSLRTIVRRGDVAMYEVGIAIQREAAREIRTFESLVPSPVACEAYFVRGAALGVATGFGIGTIVREAPVRHLRLHVTAPERLEALARALDSDRWVALDVWRSEDTPAVRFGIALRA